jgi:anti-sigma B factor antagonist
LNARGRLRRDNGPHDGQVRPPQDNYRRNGAGGFVDLKLDHHSKDGIEIVDVEGEIDVYTAPRLRELLIELVNSRFYQLVVNMEKVEFLDSTGLGVLVGGLKRVRAHDGSLDLVCTQERILKIFRITGLTKVFGIHDTVDEAIAARRAEK